MYTQLIDHCNQAILYLVKTGKYNDVTEVFWKHRPTIFWKAISTTSTNNTETGHNILRERIATIFVTLMSKYSRQK